MSKTTPRKEHHQWLFSAIRLPARITAEESASLLGFQAHDIPVLVTKGLLSPCGNAKGNCPKYFPAKEIIELCANVGWIHKATKAIAHQWKRRNAAARNQNPTRHQSHGAETGNGANLDGGILASPIGAG